MPVKREYQPIGNVITDETAARLLNTDYTNNTGQMLLALVTVECQTALLNDQAYANALVAGVGCGSVGIFQMFAGTPHRLFFMISIAVPIGAVYRLNTTVGGNGAVLLVNWTEVQLVAPTSAGF